MSNEEVITKTYLTNFSSANVKGNAISTRSSRQRQIGRNSTEYWMFIRININLHLIFQEVFIRQKKIKEVDPQQKNKKGFDSAVLNQEFAHEFGSTDANKLHKDKAKKEKSSKNAGKYKGGL